MIALLIGLFLLFILVGVPVSIAMGTASVAAIVFDGRFTPAIAAQALYRGLDSFPLLAIPFFILAAELLTGGQLSAILLRVALICVGRIRGGLGYANVVGITLFSGISGSAIADVAGPGSVAMKMMRDSGYPRSYAAALTGAIAIVGSIIPPSIIMILYSLVDDSVSIGTLFVAGIVPGIIISGSMCLVNLVFSWRHGRSIPLYETGGMRNSLITILKAGPVIVLPVFIVVSIHAGLATPTEASVVAVVYAFLLGVVVYRTIPIRELPDILMRAATASISVLLLLATAQLFAWILTVSQVPQTIFSMFAGFERNEFLLAVTVMLLLLGMFVEPAPAILIAAPILAPAAHALGIDPIHFAIIFIVNVTLGMLTPPVGSLLFVTSAVSGIDILRLAKAVAPFFVVHILVLMLLIFFPAVVLGLPGWVS